MSSSTRLFIGNLPEHTNENDIRNAFSFYGAITNLELKCKQNETEKKFAFITLSDTSNYNIESCIQKFSKEDFHGHKLYVTRARESFLERLQRERQQAQNKETGQDRLKNNMPKKDPTIKLSDKLNPRKRKKDNNNGTYINIDNEPVGKMINKNISNKSESVKNKHDSESKRQEAMKKNREQFKQKQHIIRTALNSIDKVPNKKVIFEDEEIPIKNSSYSTNTEHKNNLFDDLDASDNDVKFEIKKQFEGQKGQKILDLQSRYISDKRFTLDEKFIDEDQSEDEGNEENEQIDVEQSDEKASQLKILQDILGVNVTSTHKRNQITEDKKIKSIKGMVRFDPVNPEHAKFLVPAQEKKQEISQKKSKKNNLGQDQETKPEQNIEKIEVSKEQFYEVSETLKNALTQPGNNTFSLRNLFANNEHDTKEVQVQKTEYATLDAPKTTKVRNPLDPGQKNPFVYDSSDSEDEKEMDNKIKAPTQMKSESKAVWKENLFISKLDSRLIEGLTFFNKTGENDGHKERRELKSLMKKRIHNNERNNQMFKKKIGGRKKSMKKNFKRKS